MQTVDMNKIVGSHDILFVCMDSLRYDVAIAEEKSNGTPVLNQYGKWRKCQAPGNFTYPSHQAMFAGFLPVDEEVKDTKDREKLFFSADIGMGRIAPGGAWVFKQSTWVEQLAEEGYETICIGGVSFFDKRTEMGRVMPSYFKQSYWKPAFGCRVKESAKHQVDFALRCLKRIPKEQMVMMYINISAMHYPNYFYLEGDAQEAARPGSCGSMRDRRDSVEAHGAALRYVDSQLGRLFYAFGKRRDTFVICCSDHGTCYGEDGVWYHGVNHPIVNTVPYKHSIIKVI